MDDSKTPPPIPAVERRAEPPDPPGKWAWALPYFKYLVGAIVAMITPILFAHFKVQTVQETAAKAAVTSAEVKKTATDTATLNNAQLQELLAMRALVAELAVEQKRQIDREAARRKTATRGPADTAKVKGSQAAAAKALKEIKERALAPVPALVPVQIPPPLPTTQSQSSRDAGS